MIRSLRLLFVLSLQLLQAEAKRCEEGYEKIDGVCVDRNECTEEPDVFSFDAGVCPDDRKCTNTEGSYHCKECADGFELDLFYGKNCYDIDECKRNPCGEHGDCQNTLGSFECKCHSGFAKLEDSDVCQDIDECADENGGCDHFCENSAGSHTCSCRSGYELARNGRLCFNINECFTGTHECDDNGYCKDTEGDYECACKRGYELVEDKRTCQDIDECWNDPCGEGAQCTNTLGSYECNCKPGYRDLITGCEDIDECQAFTYPCAESEVCTNQPGSFRCSCKEGWFMDGDSCIQQCNKRDNPCPSGQACKKIDGVRKCVIVTTTTTTTKTTTAKSTTKKVPQTTESTNPTTIASTTATEKILGLPKVIFYVAIIGASILLIGAIVGIVLAVKNCRKDSGYDYSSGIKTRGASMPMHRPSDGHGFMPSDNTLGTSYSGRTTLPHGQDTTRSDSFRPIPPRTKPRYMNDYEYQ
ncbi:Oidioi.mRNA.OKI2018_I69.PAR.g10133.t1.cds [Oikopleura dioica]|uniref:Oidioi.mRNA.OKI2018_I69.PAR.g10133.t1.cds n=1 Tax=Oikopleura dioica TaxID=34765 RepID=A0ABN7RP03_OIKDI|nr:Oidioi.mRNA.OKI2018_I69.PAR.g10133.t1.cds [Oikopleura dioica]